MDADEEYDEEPSEHIASAEEAESSDEEINRPLSHKEALNYCNQLATYTFAHSIDSFQLNALTDECRKRAVGSMQQKTIDFFFRST
jgi:hypothetical protein